ncbi:MAG: tRNA(Ile)-lysidine synthetase [Bacilli bacterium]|nr:tRNA(Ile)-lysidine synthetase [Bacilli bacterium]
MELVEKVNRIIEDEHLFEAGDSIVVAVSGGPDSVALLHVLFLLAKQWRWRLIVAHVNHQFRGAESDREAEFVANFAKKLELAFEMGTINVPQYIQESGLNGQAAARKKRYEFLQQVAVKYQARSIALAHHADDQAETVLMRLIRGTGMIGLAGISLRRTIKNMELIRPLLRIYKSEVLDHCQKHGLSYCSDSSNLHSKYVRNQIRHELIPFLEKYNPQLPQSLNRLADVIGYEDDFIAQEVDAVYQKLVAAAPNSLRLPRSGFVLLHPALQRRLIKLILNYLAPNADSFDFIITEKVRAAILQETPTTLKLNIGAGIVFTREYEQILFRINPGLPASFKHRIDARDGQLELSEGLQLRHYITDCKDRAFTEFPRSNDTAYFDLEALRFPLQVRNRKDGDRIEIYGLNGSKKVKDIFIDAKLPPRLRDHMPMVVDSAERILWIPGFRRSVHAIASSNSTQLLCMELHRTK